MARKEQPHQEKPIRVPDEISMSGFENIIFSSDTNPPLTTFDQPKHFAG